MTRDPRIGYHFTGDRLRDGRPVPAVGEVLRHDGPIAWCKSGLYASPTPWGALHWAPTDSVLLHRVECEEIEQQESDKLVCRQRTIRASIDATHLLRRFAADRALSVAPPLEMLDIVREYLTGLDDSLRGAAREAVWDAAWDAACMDFSRWAIAALDQTDLFRSRITAAQPEGRRGRR